MTKAEERLLFNQVVEASIHFISAYELPISFLTVGIRFAEAIKTGERYPTMLRAMILQPELATSV